MRTCVGCRATRPRSELRRLTVDAVGRVSTASGGRGAWLCADTLTSCFATAVSKKAFRRALRRELDSGALDQLVADGFLDCGLGDLRR